MATFGNTSLTASSGLGVTRNGLFLTLFTLGEAGHLINLTVNINSSVGVAKLKGLVYQDDPAAPGYPGVVMGTTEITDIPPTASPKSYNLMFTEALYLPAGDYWLGITPGQSTYPIVSTVADTSSSLIDSADHGAFDGNPPDPMTASLQIFSDLYKMLIFAEYTPVPLWNVDLAGTQGYLNRKAGTVGLTKQQALNVLAGAPADEGMSKQEAANRYAGLDPLAENEASIQQAISTKAGTTSNDITTQEAARRL